MTITVQQMIEWLQTFPPETEVGILSVDDSGYRPSYIYHYVEKVEKIPQDFYGKTIDRNAILDLGWT